MNKRNPVPVFLVILLVLRLTTAEVAWAQGISITTTATPAVNQGQAALKLTIANQGGQPARGLAIHARFLVEKFSLPGPASLPPGKTSEHELRLGPAPQRPGIYPVLVRVIFHDSAMRPFTSLAVGMLRVGKVGRETVTVAGRPAEVPGRGEMHFTIHSSARQPIVLDVGFFTPNELTAVPRAMRVEMPPGGSTEVSVNLHSVSSATGASFPVFAVVRYSTNGQQFTAIANALVKAAGPREPLTPWRPHIWIAAAILLAAIVGLEIGRLRLTRRAR